MTQDLKPLFDYLSSQEIAFEAKDTFPYASDASFLTFGLPGCVVFPKNEDEVAKIVAFAAKNKIALTPRAKGSSTAGASITPEGGVIVITDRLGATDKFGKRLGPLAIVAVDSRGNEIPFEKLPEHTASEVYARVGAAVTTDDLDKFLARFAWQTAVVPSSGWSTIGGNFATNAGGNGTPKYGTFESIVARLRIIASSKDGAEVKTVTDREKIKKLAGGQGLYGIITELDVLIVPRIAPEELFSAVCLCTMGDIEALGASVGEFMSAMQEVCKPVIAEFMMADKGIFKDDDPLLKNAEVKEYFNYPEGKWRFITMYQGKKGEMGGLKSVAAKFKDIEYKEISAALFKVMLELRKAATGKSPGRVAIPGFEDIYVKDPRFLGRVLKKIYSITEGSLPGRPIGHQYTGGLVIHYRPLASATKKEYAEAWRLTQKLCDEICNESYQTVKRREHGLGLEIYKYATPEERKKMAALKAEFDPAGIFQPHLLTETPTIRFVGGELSELES